MSVFGNRVWELLQAQGKDASWLATQTGIAHSTISNWLTNPRNVQPKPSSVTKVAQALGIEVDDLARAGGYTIRISKDDNERAARTAALLSQSPRYEQALERLSRKSPYHQDVALSMLESYLRTVPDQE